MDLFAYANIENLNEIAMANGIEVPRLRGYRLMANEKMVDIKDEFKGIEVEVDVAENVLESIWNPNSCCREFSYKTDFYKRYYLNYHYEDAILKSPSGENDKPYKYIVYDSIRWERIHGKHRKLLKFEIKKKWKRIEDQYKIFNKYIGRDDVLYIHARIGGGNWEFYGGPELEKKPWFLEKVDDCYDRTYCDIYAKIDPELVVMQECGEAENDRQTKELP